MNYRMKIIVFFMICLSSSLLVLTSMAAYIKYTDHQVEVSNQIVNYQNGSVSEVEYVVDSDSSVEVIITTNFEKNGTIVDSETIRRSVNNGQELIEHGSIDGNYDDVSYDMEVESSIFD